VIKYIQNWTSCAGRICKWRCFLYVSHVTGRRVDIFHSQMCCCQANHSTDIELYEGAHYIS